MDKIILKCDVCGSPLTMQSGGQSAACEYCGMQYAIPRLREKIQEIRGTVSVEGVVKTASADFDIQAGVLLHYRGKDTEVVIPEEVREIGSRCFYDMKYLTSITLPEGLVRIAGSAFRGCSGLTKITIPKSITVIDDSAFTNCTGLKGVYISDLSSWCAIKFEHWTTDSTSNPLFYAQRLYLNGQLITELTIPNNVTSIGKYAFVNCTSLTSLTIPENVRQIEKEAFSQCTELKNIIFSQNLPKIEYNAFYGCSKLQTVEPSSLFCRNYTSRKDGQHYWDSLGLFGSSGPFNSSPPSPWLIHVRMHYEKCPYCGSDFESAIFFRQCSSCHRRKDY